MGPLDAEVFKRKLSEVYGSDVDINTEKSLDNSGSNETMQKVLALTV